MTASTSRRLLALVPAPSREAVAKVAETAGLEPVLPASLSAFLRELSADEHLATLLSLSVDPVDGFPLSRKV